jgi:Protein of unknown function (DUF5132)
MALFEDMFKGNVGNMMVAGAAMLLAPTVLPVIGRALRPIAKEAIKTGIGLYEEARETVGEATGDLVAEARAEVEQRPTRRRAVADRAAAGEKPGETAGTPTGATNADFEPLR